MADYLALDFEGGRLSGFDAAASKGSVRLRKSFTLAFPSDAELIGQPAAPGADAPRISDAERAQKLGEWLREKLRDLRISTKSVLVCLPREDTVVRQLEVPGDVPENELPDIVRLQAETKISSSLQQLLLDFLPLPRIPESPTRDVLMATVSKEAADRVENTLTAAGLEPAAMGVSSVAAMELVTRAEKNHDFSAEGPSLVLARHGNRLEISLLRQNQLVFTHAAQLHADSEEQAIKSTLAEVSRSFVTLERALAGSKLQRAWVVGLRQETEPLGTARAERLGCDALPLEPLSELGIRLDEPDPEANQARFAGPLGMLLAAAEPTVEHLDFLNPRKSVVGMDPGKKRLLIRSGAAAAAVLLGLIGSWAYNWSLASDVAAKKKELSGIQAEANKGKPDVEAARVVADWRGQSGDPLDELWEDNRALPGTHRVYLKEVQFIGGRGRNSRMHIQAQGFAKSRDDAVDLEQRLSEMGYKVKVLPDSVKLTSKDPDYPYEIKLDFEVPDPTKKPKKNTAAKR